MASLTSDSPSTTWPSAGMLAPGRTNNRSPVWSRLTGTVSTVPSGAMRSAVSGMSLASSCKAPEAWRTLRISSQWPSSMMSISVTNSQKKPFAGSMTSVARL